ncbi:uncharacterized protein CBL_11214 [Carabus blaptoides fortunei]
MLSLWWRGVILAGLITGQTHAQTICNTCVPFGQCYQTLPFDGTGEIDVRIVNPGSGPVPPVVSPGSPCTAGNEQCCTGGGISGCGVRYRIPVIPALNPGVGEAPYGSQPWVASILTTPNVSYVGGGVLINPVTVLTVAHKVDNRVGAPTTLKVRLGDLDSNANIEPFPVQEARVARIILHPSYMPTAGNLYNDLAILTLATPIQLAPVPNPAINTACMTNATIPDNTRCYVAGWGKNAFSGTLQTKLKLVDVPIVANSVCQTNLRKTKLGPTFILNTDTFLCAGGESGKDACVGDGGSPLVCNRGGRFQASMYG